LSGNAVGELGGAYTKFEFYVTVNSDSYGLVENGVSSEDPPHLIL